MAAKTTILIPLLIAALVLVAAETPMPAEWTPAAKELKVALDAKTGKAFEEVEAAAPPEKKEETKHAVFKYQVVVEMTLAGAKASGEEPNYVSVGRAYDKAADAVIAAPPADKFKTMESAFAAAVAPEASKCPVLDDKLFCETFAKLDKALKEIVAAAGEELAKKKEIQQAVIKRTVAYNAVINRAYADGDRKKIDEILVAYGKAADAVAAAPPPEKLKVMEETFKAAHSDGKKLA